MVSIALIADDNYFVVTFPVSFTGVNLLKIYTNYICSYSKFTELSHAIIKNVLCITVSEQWVIY